MSTDTNRAMLDSAIQTFRSQKVMADKAVAQLSFEQLKAQPDPQSNSIAVIMKHLAGNMRSRWTDLLTSDGEKDWRNRDSEFVDGYTSQAALVDDWERGWAVLFGALDNLSPDDLTAIVTIRGEKHTVFEAIHRQLSHYGYHLGQIVTQSRAQAGENWQTLTVPRGQSEAYTRSVRAAARQADQA